VRYFLISLAFFGMTAIAEEAKLPPSTNAAVEAYATAEAKAKLEYSKKETEAREALIKALVKALDAETKKSNLDGALAIKNRIDELSENDEDLLGATDIRKTMAGVYVRITDGDSGIILTLKEDGTFTFTWRNQSGRYEIKDKRIVLNNDETNYFLIKDKRTLYESGGIVFNRQRGGK
jgi:hypothetical protein